MGSGGSFPVASCNTCCSTRCGGQPTVVTVADDPPKHPNSWDLAETVLADGAVPDWIAALSPSLAGLEAAQAARAWAQYAEDLRKRTEAFVQRAVSGVPCRVFDQSTGSSTPARYMLDEAATTLSVQGIAEAEGGRIYQECRVAKVRNIWVCADSALARRFHGHLREGTADADLACILVIDAPDGMIGVVERGSEAREEFLDCMAVLIAAQRLRSEPESARCALGGRLPAPEAQLRPLGRSLQSVHLSGPICVWLARVGEDVAVASLSEGDEVEAEYLHLPALDANRGTDPPILVTPRSEPAPSGALPSTTFGGMVHAARVQQPTHQGAERDANQLDFYPSPGRDAIAEEACKHVSL